MSAEKVAFHFSGSHSTAKQLCALLHTKQTHPRWMRRLFASSSPAAFLLTQCCSMHLGEGPSIVDFFFIAVRPYLGATGLPQGHREGCDSEP